MFAFRQQPRIHVFQGGAEAVWVFFAYRLGIFGVTDVQSVIGRAFGQHGNEESAFIDFFRRRNQFATLTVDNIHTRSIRNQRSHDLVAFGKAVSSQIGKQIAVGGKKQAFDRVAFDLVKLVIRLHPAVFLHAYLSNHGKLAAHQAVVGKIFKRDGHFACPVGITLGNTRHIQVVAHAQQVFQLHRIEFAAAHGGIPVQGG